MCCCHQKCERKRGAEREKKARAIVSRILKELWLPGGGAHCSSKEEPAFCLCYYARGFSAGLLVFKIGRGEERRESRSGRTTLRSYCCCCYCYCYCKCCTSTSTTLLADRKAGWKTRVNCCSRRREKRTALDGRRNTRRATRSESAVRQRCCTETLLYSSHATHTHTHTPDHFSRSLPKATVKLLTQRESQIKYKAAAFTFTHFFCATLTRRLPFTERGVVNETSSK